MNSIKNYVRLAKLNSQTGTDFFRAVIDVRDSPLVKEGGIELMVDVGGATHPSRIVLLDKYELATDYEIHGCGCCCYQDYVLHLTTRVETGNGQRQVFLRTSQWNKSGTDDEKYHHALEHDGDFPYIEESRQRLPGLIDFYKQKGVPVEVLERVEQRIKGLIDMEDEAMNSDE